MTKWYIAPRAAAFAVCTALLGWIIYMLVVIVQRDDPVWATAVCLGLGAAAGLAYAAALATSAYKLWRFRAEQRSCRKG